MTAHGRAGVRVTLPDAPDREGTIVATPDGKRVGVWLMPDNQRAGVLEDFVDALIPPTDPTRSHAWTATSDAAQLGAPFAEKDLAKARIHTWLAWRQQPGQPFGTALTSRALAHDTVLGLAFVAWMNRLFAP